MHPVHVHLYTNSVHMHLLQVFVICISLYAFMVHKVFVFIGSVDTAKGSCVDTGIPVNGGRVRSLA